jgi:hypothetical protein
VALRVRARRLVLAALSTDGADLLLDTADRDARRAPVAALEWFDWRERSVYRDIQFATSFWKTKRCC